ncbi:Uncharacterised protein [Chryseobacterium nakagawai]|uniref:hypothetical protein n=1 Tax=Chryseobacterium nakagawai TaxID=1241982 RepID=UPI000F706560|nr:hypothetical protein [Chryseobacterium nakagawai]VEH18273.1 Uncharacterised protein [Chryseobacterium nakagawai]
MRFTGLKEIIRASGKRGVVTYKGKDTRKEFDESVNLKKVNLISNFIGNKIEVVAQILS